MHYAVSARVVERVNGGAMTILPEAPVADRKATLVLVIHLAAERYKGRRHQELRDDVEELIERRARNLLASKGHTPGPKVVSFVRDEWFYVSEDWDSVLRRRILKLPSSVPFVYVFASNGPEQNHPLWNIAITKPNNIACLHMRIKRPPGEPISCGLADETEHLLELLNLPLKSSFGLPGCLRETSSQGSVSDYYEEDLVRRFRDASIRGDSFPNRRIRTPSPPPAPITQPPYFRFVNGKFEFAKKAWLWSTSGPDYELVIQPKKWYAGGIRELYIYFFDIEFPDGLSSSTFPLREVVVEH